jgi:hypothetical protein
VVDFVKHDSAEQPEGSSVGGYPLSPHSPFSLLSHTLTHTHTHVDTGVSGPSVRENTFATLRSFRTAWTFGITSAFGVTTEKPKAEMVLSPPTPLRTVSRSRASDAHSNTAGSPMITRKNSVTIVHVVGVGLSPMTPLRSSKRTSNVTVVVAPAVAPVQLVSVNLSDDLNHIPRVSEHDAAGLDLE